MQNRWQIFTVIDITETHANKSDDTKKKHQQANYNTLINTASLRCNILPASCKAMVDDVSELGFGKNILDKQRYWVFEFTHEFEGALSLEMLMQDFDLIPIITGLNETVNINTPAFRTTDTVDKNIVFKLLDN